MAIAKAFNVSTEASTLMTSIFLCGYVGGPILWAPMSELFGRKPVFVGTMFCYVVLQLGDALGKNFGTLLSTRFLAGLFAACASGPLIVGMRDADVKARDAAPLTNAGGLIADIWDPIGRGPAMSVFTASVFMSAPPPLSCSHLGHADAWRLVPVARFWDRSSRPLSRSPTSAGAGCFG